MVILCVVISSVLFAVPLVVKALCRNNHSAADFWTAMVLFTSFVAALQIQP